MYLFPSVDEARVHVLQQLYAWQAIVTSQTRLQSTRYQVGWDCPTHETYRNLITKLPAGNSVLENAYQAIDNKIKQVSRENKI